jgi:hypothetical protein
VNEDYLWDRSGPEDPEIARLERSLGMLRAQDPPAPLRLPATSAASAASTAPATSALRDGSLRDGSDRDHAMPGLGRRFVLPFAVAATLALAAATLWLSVNPYGPRPSWQISRLDGMPRVASQAMSGPTGQLPVGEWVETDGQARARIKVAHIGHVDVEPHSQVGLMSTRPGNYRLRLERGALQALILAPPGQFHVETPAAVATDLGCAYRLTVDERGESELRVTSGWVSLDRSTDQVSSRSSWSSRSSSSTTPSSFVRSGARCLARPGTGPRTGPGTPFMEDVSEAFSAALRLIDFGDEQGRPATDAARAAAFERVLTEARAADAITLWHLLARLDAYGSVSTSASASERAYRDRLFDRLAAFAPPPKNVTREGIQAGESGMLDRWWDGSRLGPRRSSAR